MEYEYTVMKQVDQEEPVEAASVTYPTFRAADNLRADLEYNANGGHDGYNVTSALEARRVAILLEEAEKTRYFVARRQVTEWEEINSWDDV